MSAGCSSSLCACGFGSTGDCSSYKAEELLHCCQRKAGGLTRRGEGLPQLSVLSLDIPLSMTTEAKSRNTYRTSIIWQVRALFNSIKSRINASTARTPPQLNQQMVSSKDVIIQIYGNGSKENVFPWEISFLFVVVNSTFNT